MPQRSDNVAVSVVICAYTMARLDQTIDSVLSALAQDPAPEVVVVVDHNDELRGRLRDLLPSAVEIVPNTGPRGLSGARNTGIGASRGGVIAFLDDDATAAPGWLAALVVPFADPAVVGTGGRAVAAWAAGQPRWFPDEYLWVVGCSYDGQPRNGDVRNVLGCSMAFRARLFETIGGFDPAVGRLGNRPLGAEETELCIRARRIMPGARIVMVEDALVIHHVPASRAAPGYFLRRCFYEGVSKALLRRLSPDQALASERAYTATVLPRAALRNLRAALALDDPAGALGRTAALLGGLLAAGAGFVAGSAITALRGSQRTASPPLPEAAFETSPPRPVASAPSRRARARQDIHSSPEPAVTAAAARGGRKGPD